MFQRSANPYRVLPIENPLQEFLSFAHLPNQPESWREVASQTEAAVRRLELV